MASSNALSAAVMSALTESARSAASSAAVAVAVPMDSTWALTSSMVASPPPTRVLSSATSVWAAAELVQYCALVSAVSSLDEQADRDRARPRPARAAVMLRAVLIVILLIWCNPNGSHMSIWYLP